MSRLKAVLIGICILVPLGSLYYKSEVLGLSLIPKKANNSWDVELSPNVDNISEGNMGSRFNMTLPIPQSLKSQSVDRLTIRGLPSGPPDGKQPIISLNEKDAYKKIDVKFQVSTFFFDYLGAEAPKARLSAAEKKRYLDLSALSEATAKKVEKLSDTLVFSADSKMEKIKKIFFYIADEVVLQPDSKTIDEVIDLANGDHLAQSLTLASVAKLNGIPSKIGFGLKIINDPKNAGEVKFTRFFYVESHLDGRWVPLFPEDRLFGKVTDKHIILNQDAEAYEDFWNARDYLSMMAKPLKFDPLTSKEQLNFLSEVSPIWALFSLHRFSLSIQAIFLGIVLIPFGTIILSFARVVVGINTFGIFMPMLLSLFFLETSFVFGFTFFVLVVLLGLSQRALLDRLHLLAVPRLSILLAAVILLYIIFAVITDNMGFISVNNKTLNYFPIVIITVFIERFSIYFIEEGAVNTLKTTVGTFVVATLCYYLLSYKWLKVFLFNNPELLILTIGVNLAIGSYQGYRLFELFRFRDLGKVEDEPVS